MWGERVRGWEGERRGQTRGRGPTRRRGWIGERAAALAAALLVGHTNRTSTRRHGVMASWK
ncbi:MAG: hypothetical protein ACKESB_01565 [Candidatus Hodgkinia cicadicola]